MLNMNLQAVADAVGGHLTELGAAELEANGCSTDSRSISSGALFFALRGPSFDGHRFAAAAIAQGAAAAVVDAPQADAGPQIVVADTRAALGRLAAAWRRQHQVRVVGVTGSNGKTTVKEMVASCLRVHANSHQANSHQANSVHSGPDDADDVVLATQGNFNNDIGLPMTLFRLAERHRFAVLEMGANHPGEIATLATIASPEVGLITQCAPAHLEGFGSIEGVAQAKGELFEALAPSGTAIINADDAYGEHWMGMAAHCRQMSFGLKVGADVSGRFVTDCVGSRVVVQSPSGRFSVHLPLPGRHNVLNALGTTAICLALGVPVAHIVRGLERVSPVPGRLCARRTSVGARILDDTYNANPASLAAALDVLRNQQGRCWLVLGDMAELGPDSARFHTEAGQTAREAGVERLYTLGEHSANALSAFGSNSRHFTDAAALTQTLERELESDVIVLVKGSRSMRMERIVQGLVEAA